MPSRKLRAGKADTGLWHPLAHLEKMPSLTLAVGLPHGPRPAPVTRLLTPLLCGLLGCP